MQLFSDEVSDVARVALPVPVDRLFDYTVPPHLSADAQPGRRVRVGVGARKVTGIIVERAREAARAAARKPLDAVLDAEAVLPASLIAVLRAEAEAVLCPVGIALHSALPPGSAPRAVRGFALTARGREALRSGAARGVAARVLAALEARGRTAAELARAAEASDDDFALLARDGLVAGTALERGSGVRPASVRFVQLAPGVELEAACAALARAPRQLALLREIAAAGALQSSALTAKAARAAGLLRALAARGFVAFEERAVALEHALSGAVEAPRLTPEQQAACDAIGAAVRERRPDSFLLHGITGSGKTEVYLHAVADALACGRQALVLVPEITLTHQILGRLRARFGDRLAVLHSGLTPRERLAQWQRLRLGATPIAVGARSALFAPINNLGVIVVDEEHDGAYKNEEGFRYHARSLAARRAAIDACPLVLGSATPSLETRAAADRRQLTRLRLEHRIASRPLPSVEIVDLVRERSALPRGRKLILSAPLLRAMRQALGDRAQTILFLNRRGFSTQIACAACQHVARCKDCDISLTYHAAERALRCHYCDWRIPPPEVCPSCGAPDAALLGVGTERVVEEVRLHFPEARTLRLDRDTAARRGASAEVLRALHDGTVDVVVGTQMVAKGHDFPGVRLVGIVNADIGLHIPDFRAAERTFQLLTQVAGRAGRGDAPGRVIVQTYLPTHYAIAPVAQHDYERFYAEEIAHRQALAYPPFGELGLVRVNAAEESAAQAGAERLAVAARAAAAPLGCEVLGPAPAPIAKLRSRYRMQLLLKHRDAAAVREVAAAVLAAAQRLPGDVRASVDVSPIDMR